MIDFMVLAPALLGQNTLDDLSSSEGHTVQPMTASIHPISAVRTLFSLSFSMIRFIPIVLYYWLLSPLYARFLLSHSFLFYENPGQSTADDDLHYLLDLGYYLRYPHTPYHPPPISYN